MPRTGQSGAGTAAPQFHKGPSHLLLFTSADLPRSFHPFTLIVVAGGCKVAAPYVSVHVPSSSRAQRGRSNLRCLLNLLPFKGLLQKPNPTSSIYNSLATTISQSHSYLENARFLVYLGFLVCFSWAYFHPEHN